MFLTGNEHEGHFKCDICGRYGFPDEFAYIGPKDREDQECSIVMAWEQICEECAR